MALITVMIIWCLLAVVLSLVGLIVWVVVSEWLRFNQQMKSKGG